MKAELPAACSPAGRPRTCLETPGEDFHRQEETGGAAIQRVWSGDNPPAGTTQWTCG